MSAGDGRVFCSSLNGWLRSRRLAMWISIARCNSSFDWAAFTKPSWYLAQSLRSSPTVTFACRPPASFCSTHKFSCSYLIIAATAAWLSGNVLVLINVVALCQARLVLGWVTVRGYTILVFNQSHPSLLSLAIPPWVHTMSTGGDLGKKRRVLRNSGPVPGLLAYWPSRLKALVTMGPAIWLTCVIC